MTWRGRLGAAVVLLGGMVQGAVPVQAGERPLALQPGERVVLLGGTFIEREGQFGHLETALRLAHPGQPLVVRNLGWSGDTVWAESRGIFDPPNVGYQRMIALVKELQPTVIVLAYGQNEAFGGAAKLAAFVQQYETLCHDLAVTKARLVLLTPHLFEKPQPPLPDASVHNPALEQYAGAIRELAQRRQAGLVDLTTGLAHVAGRTENGVHLSPVGYAAAAQVVWQATGAAKPDELSPGTVARHRLVQQRVVAKNTLFFHRWRPQNITYLTGFRKHEQGNNAVEIAQFEPLVEAAEKAITAATQP